MTRNRFEKLTYWIAICGSLTAVVLVWLDSVLRPVAISDSVIATARSNSADEVNRNVATLIRDWQMKTAFLITLIETAVLIALLFNLRRNVFDREKP